MKQTTKQAHQANTQIDDTQYVISPRQSTTLIASTVIGSGILTLPKVASRHAHETAWLSVICATFIALFLVYMMTKLALRFPRQTIIDYMGDIFSIKSFPLISYIPKYVISIFLMSYWIISLALITRIFGEVLTTTVLGDTPIRWVIIPIIILALILIFYEVEVLARFNEIVFPIIILPIIFFAFLSFKKANYLNVLPFFAIDWSDFLKSVLDITFSFLGFGIMYVFMAYTQKEKNMKDNLFGVGIPGGLYLLVIIACLSVFGFKELQHIQWSTLALVKTTVFPGFILERSEAAFIGVWVIAIFTTVANMYYTSCFSLAQLLPIKHKNRARFIIALLLSPIIYFLAVLPKNIHDIFTWTRYINNVGLLTFFILPIILLIIATIRKKGAKHDKTT